MVMTIQCALKSFDPLICDNMVMNIDRLYVLCHCQGHYIPYPSFSLHKVCTPGDSATNAILG